MDLMTVDFVSKTVMKRHFETHYWFSVMYQRGTPSPLDFFLISVDCFMSSELIKIVFEILGGVVRHVVLCFE